MAHNAASHTDDDIEENGFKQNSHFPEVIQRKIRNNSGQRVQKLSHISESAEVIAQTPNFDKKLSELDKKTNNMEEKLSEIVLLLKKFSDK